MLVVDGQRLTCLEPIGGGTPRQVGQPLPRLGGLASPAGSSPAVRQATERVGRRLRIAPDAIEPIDSRDVGHLGLVRAPGAIVDPGQSQALVGVGRGRRSPLDETHRPRQHQRQRDEIEAVVLEHGLERPRVTVADELEVARRDLEPRHVADPMPAAEHALERPERATGLIGAVHGAASLPQAARRVQHVGVRHVLQRERHAVEQVAGLDQRHVERLAVEGDQRSARAGPAGDLGQQRPLVLVAGQQELPDVQAIL